jgi:hypothetical protein
MKYDFKNTAILSGKVLLLITIILIFSYINILHDKAEKKEIEKTDEKAKNVIHEGLDKIFEKIESLKFDNIIEHYNNLGKEGFDGPEMETEKEFKRLEKEDAKKKANQAWEDAKQGKCVLQLNVVFKLPIWIVMFLIKVVIILVKFLISPVDYLLEALLGEYYKMLKKIFQSIYKVYSTIIKIFFTIFEIIWRIFFTIINIFFVILFAIIPEVLLNMFSILLAFPFVIFGFLSPLFRIFKFLKVICWSKNGIVNDLTWVYIRIYNFEFSKLIPSFD